MWYCHVHHTEQKSKIYFWQNILSALRHSLKTKQKPNCIFILISLLMLLFCFIWCYLRVHLLPNAIFYAYNSKSFSSWCELFGFIQLIELIRFVFFLFILHLNNINFVVILIVFFFKFNFFYSHIIIYIRCFFSLFFFVAPLFSFSFCLKNLFYFCCCVEIFNINKKKNKNSSCENPQCRWHLYHVAQ